MASHRRLLLIKLRNAINGELTIFKHTVWQRIGTLALAASVTAIVCLAALASPVWSGQVDIVGPPDSGAFGTSVTVLPNGNIVITDPDAGASKTGAVYLYGPDGSQISRLTGSSPGDHVGRAGIVVLTNGNFVRNRVRPRVIRRWFRQCGIRALMRPDRPTRHHAALQAGGSAFCSASCDGHVSRNQGRHGPVRARARAATG